MNVYCTTCRKPWDVFWLRFEIIFGTTLSEEELDIWDDLPRREKLLGKYEAAFAAIGWKFGGALVNIIRCPSCPADAVTPADRVAIKAALTALLKDDQDVLASIFADHCHD